MCISPMLFNIFSYRTCSIRKKMVAPLCVLCVLRALCDKKGITPYNIFYHRGHKDSQRTQSYITYLKRKHNPHSSPNSYNRKHICHPIGILCLRAISIIITYNCGFICSLDVLFRCIIEVPG